jgi:hypothetical protein
MNTRTLLLLSLAIIAGPVPAFADPPGEGGYSRRDRDDMEDMMRGLGERRGERQPRAAAFFIKNGDAMVAVRCDPQDSMKLCMDATMALLERARSINQPPSSSTTGSSSGSSTSPGSSSTPTR